MPRKYSGPLRRGERSAKVPRKMTKKISKPSAKMVRSVLFRTLETKYKSIDFDKTELYHNSITYLANKNLATNLPGQGDADAERVGDEIYLTGIKLRLLLGQKYDRPNCTFKIWIVEANSVSGNANDKNVFFHNTTGNILLDPIQSKRFSILKAITVKPKGTAMEVGEAGKEFVRPLSLWLPMRRKIHFVADASTSVSKGMKEHLYILLGVYDAYGTLTTDNIAYCQGSATYYYKDP